jgi:hypothetical protein
VENNTKLALGIAASGFAANRYMNNLQKGQPYLTTEQSQTKILGGAVTVLGLASAGILEFTKNNPRNRKIAFATLGGLTVGYVALLFYAIKKMT